MGVLLFMDKLISEIEKLIPFWENMTGVCIFVKDMTGRYIYVNTAFAEFVGRSISSILYKKAEDVWKNRRQIDLLISDEKSLLNGTVGMVDTVMVMKNSANEDRSMRILKIPLYKDREKEIIGISGICIDITHDREKLLTVLHILFRRLSKSEKQYFFFRSEGRTRAEIAKDMDTTVETVDSYRHRIMKKLVINEKEMFFLESVYRLFIDYSFP